jgi:dTMP kinase
VNRQKGILIAFEGIDGAGKTTQVQLLAEELRAVGETVTVSKEPTDGPWGQKIRDSAKNGRLPLQEELEAFTEDRKQHVENLIRPSLEEGHIVILDRYFYSTIAYQGSRGADILEVDQEMREIAPVPDMVFLIDVSPRRGVLRITEDREELPNHFEREDSLASVRQVFNDLSETDERIWKVDGSLAINAVHRTVLNLLIEHALKDKRCAKSYGCDNLVDCGPRLNGKCDWYKVARSLAANPESGDVTALISAPTVKGV